MTLADVIRQITDCQTSSAQRWEMAIETDDSDRGFAADAEECDAAYDTAVEILTEAYDDYRRSARVHLENARRLELGAGDDQDARRAIAALDDLDGAEG